MKFTDFHIAVVTFRSLKFIFPFLVLSYAFFVRYTKARKERGKKGRNRTRHKNMMGREINGENTRTREKRKREVCEIKEREREKDKEKSRGNGSRYAARHRKRNMGEKARKIEKYEEGERVRKGGAR